MIWGQVCWGDYPVDDGENKKQSKTIICYGYPLDLEQMYAFYCARYENVSFKTFLSLGIEEFTMKLNSIPKDEPLYDIIKSRTVNIGNIKNKDERKYWRELKKINQIPDIYKTNEEIEQEIKEQLKNYEGAMLNE